MNLTQQYIIDKSKVVYRIIDNEAVILNLDSGYYFSLDEVGTKIFEAMGEDMSVVEIINCLKEEYQVSEERLKKDIFKLVSKLERAELIKKIKA